MLSVLYFWLGLGLVLGFVDVALAIASCTYALVNIPDTTFVNSRCQDCASMLPLGWWRALAVADATATHQLSDSCTGF